MQNNVAHNIVLDINNWNINNFLKLFVYWIIMWRSVCEVLWIRSEQVSLIAFSTISESAIQHIWISKKNESCIWMNCRLYPTHDGHASDILYVYCSCTCVGAWDWETKTRAKEWKRDRVVILLSSGRCLHWFPKAPDIFMSLAGKMLLFTVYVLGISCHGNGFRALLKPMKAGLPREMSGKRDKLLWRLSDDDLSMYMFAPCVGVVFHTIPSFSVQFCLSSDKIYANIWIKHWNEIKIFKHIMKSESCY